jgi:hypothetical protein
MPVGGVHHDLGRSATRGRAKDAILTLEVPCSTFANSALMFAVSGDAHYLRTQPRKIPTYPGMPSQASWKLPRPHQACLGQIFAESGAMLWRNELCVGHCFSSATPWRRTKLVRLLVHGFALHEERPSRSAIAWHETLYYLDVQMRC